MGSNPVLPGDMHTDLDLSRLENLQQLVEGLKTNAAQPAHQTSAHREPPVHVPEGLDRVTHVTQWETYVVSTLYKLRNMFFLAFTSFSRAIYGFKLIFK